MGRRAAADSREVRSQDSYRENHYDTRACRSLERTGPAKVKYDLPLFELKLSRKRRYSSPEAKAAGGAEGPFKQFRYPARGPIPVLTIR